MKKLILLSVALLTGCSMFQQAVPVTAKFPDPVPDLMVKCENLMTVEGDKVAMTELLKTIVHNYTLYYQCSNKVEGWQEWYEKQKKIFEDEK